MDLSAIDAARSSPARLAAVRATRVLDAGETEALDRFSRLAVELLGVPVAFLSLVDADRDFYASQTGFTGELAESRELRGPTFCHLGLVSGGAVVIDDTRADPVYRSVPTVSSLGVAAYLGIPVSSTDGQIVGSMCAIDFEPRRWSARDREVLQVIADAARRELALLARLGDSVRQADQSNAARRSLESAARTRQEVFARVSHDLRTPLSTMLLALESIALATSDPRAVKAMAVARRQAEAMRGLIDDLLDDARLEEGTIHLSRRPVFVAELLRDLVRDFELSAQAARVAIEMRAAPELPPVDLDRRRMEQALGNLISNALRFTPAGGTIRLAARKVGEDLELEVSDTGPGISPAVVGKMFEPYCQGEPGTGSGLGLGLHICRGIVENHGGRIWARSIPGHGASFTIRVPLAPG